ncbi:MAG: PTS sugar transporter subunit IIA [Alphaproteobacteria bacterium]
MELKDILSADMVFAELPARGKKQVLADITAKLTAKMGLDNTDVFELILEREKLGSTGMGRGIAIPHARIPGLKHIVGAFAQLDTPIEFGSVDDQPVRLVFMLLAPEKSGAEHLKALSIASRTLRDRKFCKELANKQSHDELYKSLIAQSEKEG